MLVSADMGPKMWIGSRRKNVSSFFFQIYTSACMDFTLWNQCFNDGLNVISYWTAEIWSDITFIFQEVLAFDQVYHLLHDLGEEIIEKHGIIKWKKSLTKKYFWKPQNLNRRASETNNYFLGLTISVCILILLVSHENK